MGWVTIHAPNGDLLFEEGREQNPHRKPSREEYEHGEEIVIQPIERTAAEREWRDREIAKRLKEIEDGTYE